MTDSVRAKPDDSAIVRVRGLTTVLNGKTIFDALDLDIPRGKQGLNRMVRLPHREIKDCEHRIANRFVQQAVITPDRRGTVVIEGIEQRSQRGRLEALRECRIAAQIREHDRGVDGYRAGLHDP